MSRNAWSKSLAAFLLMGSISGLCAAKLPAPTPEQQQAAAAKKAQAAEQAAKEKQQLSDSMDRISERWRGRAAKEGWKTHPPTPVAAQSGAPAPGQPQPAGAPTGATTGAATGAAPNAAAAPASAPTMPPIRSEKFGTAPPSADVKTNTRSGTRVNERIYKNTVEEPPHKKPEK